MSKIKGVRLRPLALEVNEESLGKVDVFRIDMPLSWVEFLGQFQANASEPWKLRIKIGSLAVKLQSMFPEIIWINDRTYWQPRQPWIVSTATIPKDMIMAFCMGWFQDQVSRWKGDIKHAEPPNEKDLEWQSIKVSEVVSSSNQYQLIPALMANQFCQTPRQLPISEDDGLPAELLFSQVHAKNEAECMSQLMSTSKGTYAYVIRFRMKTRGGQGHRRLLLFSLGIRRFVTEPYVTEESCFVSGDTKSSILVSLDNPFLRERGYISRSYAKIWFQRKGGKRPFTQWVEGSDLIFWDVLWGKSVSSDDVLREPKAFIRDDAEVQVLVVYNRLFRKSLVGAGTGFPEKEAFFQLVCDAFPDWKPLESLPEVPGKKSVSRSYTQLPPLFSIEEKRLSLEIWGSSELFNKTVDTLKTAMYQGKPLATQQGKYSYKLNCFHEVWVELIHKEPEKYLGSLDIETYKKQAFEQRVIEIEKALAGNGSKSTFLALIEILPSHYYQPEETDPKLAIREGFRRSRRLTQFIHPDDEKISALEHRLLNSILDLLSDVGIMDKSVIQLAPELNIIGFDILNVKKRDAESKFGEEEQDIPVFTKFIAGALFVKGWGMENWLTLQEAMLQADQFKGWKYKDKNKVTQLLDEVLREEIGENEFNYILLNADLRNYYFKALTNAQIHPEKNPNVLPWIEDIKNVRFIRINTTDEVPAYLFEPLSYASGVFKDECGIYYGIGRKMDTIQIKKTKTKFLYPKEFFRQPKNTEYIPLGFTNDAERDLAALLVHDLRNVGITFGTHTAQPYPFHMLRSLKKYINQTSYKEWELEPEFAEGEE